MWVNKVEAKTVKKKLNFKKLFILILVLYLVSYGGYYIYKKPIKNIIITGNTLINDYEIIEIAEIRDYPAILGLNTKTIKSKIESLTLIESVTVKRDLKFRLILEVKEAKILFLNSTTNKLMLSNLKYIDNLYDYEGVPTLINFTPENFLKEFSNKLGELNTDIISLISEIEYSPTMGEDGTIIDDTRFTLHMNDGNTVYTNISKCKNLSYYSQIYASLKEKKGYLNLDSGNYEIFVFIPY